MKTTMLKLCFIGFTAIAFTACSGDDDDDPTPPVSDEEVITDLRLTFTDSEGTSQTFSFSDPDGEGGNVPVLDIISLTPDAYTVSIEVLDASNPNDVEDITAEILEKDEEHQFFFVTSGSASDVVTIAYVDADADGRPIGLSTTWTVSGITEVAGSVVVTLLHEPNKTAEGIAIDNPSVAGGETDIEVLFDFVAQ